ncbi:protein FAM107B isoform X1 [Pseudophryne corroboree]|uniref:protein FAM107B isoform X1 n=2 Tax=Pseudophryne corroboree TaxID=495146 RepID=UPI003081AA00
MARGALQDLTSCSESSPATAGGVRHITPPAGISRVLLVMMNSSGSGLGRMRDVVRWLVLALIWGLPGTAAQAECEVCKEYLHRLYQSLVERNIDFTPAAIERELINTCRDATGKENRLNGQGDESLAKADGKVWNRCALSGNSPIDSEFGDTYLIVKSIMAEPDYIESDNPDLIKPNKLVNPVKTSRNHQDLHRELLMNQKRGLSPQNKPELQKVMEKRKRDQVIKLQKEEAEQKMTDLEIELQKRHQKLEEMEMEKHKTEEEQENKPEFLKVKGNLRRMNHEITNGNDS